MTTASTTTRVRHDSDAEFRLWGSEFSTQLAAVGLVKTADTGQINWTTVTRPAVVTDAGYEVWRFNDTHQSTCPIFIKFYYGTHSTAASPRIRVQFGTGSDGSGALTGQRFSGSIFILNSSSTQTATTTRASYWSASDGFFGFVWKAASSSECAMLISRYSDDDGDPTDIGFLIQATGNAGQVLRALGMKTATYDWQVTGISTPCALNPCTFLAGNVSGDVPVFPVFGMNRFESVHVMGIVGILLGSAVALGTTFSTDTVGKSRTYLMTNIATGYIAAVNTTNNQAVLCAMLWE